MKIFRVLASLLIGLLALVFILGLSYEPYRCNLVTKVCESMLAAAMSGNPAAQLFLRERMPLIDQCIAHTPGKVELRLIRGAAQSLSGDYEGALTTYQETLLFDRRPEIYFDIGGALLKLRRTDEAIDAYATAIRFNPDLLPQISDPLLRSRVETRSATATIPVL